MTKRVLAYAVGLAIAASLAAHAYPDKPIRLVAGFAAGEPAEAIGRAVAHDMSATLGQSVVVEAADAIRAAQEVKRATPDGYTLLLTGLAHNLDAVLRAPAPYDPIQDFAPVTLLCLLPLLMLTGANAPFDSVQDVLNAAKASPGEITYASSGSGGPAHLAGIAFEALGKVKLAHVPFGGNARALANVMSGRVSFMFYPMIGVAEHAARRRLKVLASSTAKRQRDYPNVRTMAESGFPGFEKYTEGVGIAVPAGTPTPIIGRLNEAVRASLAKAATRAKFKALGAVTDGGSTPEHFAAWLAAERQRVERLVKAAGVKAQ